MFGLKTKLSPAQVTHPLQAICVPLTVVRSDQEIAERAWHFVPSPFGISLEAVIWKYPATKQ